MAAVTLGGCLSVRPPAPVQERTVLSSEPSEASRSGLNAPGPAQAPSKSVGQSTSRRASSPDWRPENFAVKKGDTLYSVALDHGLDYRELAAWNNLNDPNRIFVGQKLTMRAPPGWQPNPVLARPLEERASPPGEPLPEESVAASSESATVPSGPQSARATPDAIAKPVLAERAGGFDAAAWKWPALGDLKAAFDGSRNKGMTIAGKLGDPVLASNGGKVVYVGRAIKTYGQLVIIKHSEDFLTVYAHNSTILVKEGQRVGAGQKIAEMGEKSAKLAALHFEIRKLGRPVDPATFLPAR